METAYRDQDSKASLEQMTEQSRIRQGRLPGVKTVLVVLSSRGMVFDIESLRQKIGLAYTDAAVFFRTTDGKDIGAACPARVDLVIDFTGPGQRQGWFYARRLRRMARIAVGRNAGLFRKGSYDRIFDEKSAERVKDPSLPRELLERERFVQKKVLELVGVGMAPVGDTPVDRSKSIALELPALQRTVRTT